jgi:hypothetical protein
MILYHVSVNLDHDGEFFPDIPDSAFYVDEEDSITPRICFSDSINGCLGSIPDGGRGLKDYISSVDSKFKVFILATEKYNVRILTPEEIADRVPDALIHREYWVLDPITINEYMIIDIKDFTCITETDAIENLEYEIVTL